MAQNPGLRVRVRATSAGLESTFGTTSGALKRHYPIEAAEVELMQDAIQVETESTISQDMQLPTKGFKSASLPISYYLQPNAAQSDAAATVTADHLDDFLGGIMGGSSLLAGSTVQSGSTSSQVNVGTGHGVRFPIGSIVAVQTSVGLEPCAVISVPVTDEIGVYPTLSGTPTNGGKIINGRTNYLTESNTQSFTYEVADADDNNYQYILNAGMAETLELTLKRNANLACGAKMQFGPWSGPSNQSVDHSYSANPLAPPIVLRDATHILQPITTLTRNRYPLDNIAFKGSSWNKHITEYGNIATEGLNSVQRSMVRPSCEVTVQAIIDKQFWADYAQATPVQYALFSFFTSGSGTTARFVVLFWPTLVMLASPKLITRDQHYRGMELRLGAQINNLTLPPTAALAASSFYLSRI
jgi:hypothetical protein